MLKGFSTHFKRNKLKYIALVILIIAAIFVKEVHPEDKEVWFQNWKEGVLLPLIHDIAKPYKVYALCIGSNFDQFEKEYDHWTDVSKFVRINYQGRITYKTNWWYNAAWDTQKDGKHDTYTTKLNNPVFQNVDYISVAAYFELTDKETNTVENLVHSLSSTQIFDRHQNIPEELKNLSSKYNKPVFFGELGFPKRNRATVQPWNPEPSKIFNEQEQANGFQAYKEVFEKESWNLGFSVFAIGKKDKLKNYYPCDQSINVIKNWYK